MCVPRFVSRRWLGLMISVGCYHGAVAAAHLAYRVAQLDVRAKLKKLREDCGARLPAFKCKKAKRVRVVLP